MGIVHHRLWEASVGKVDVDRVSRMGEGNNFTSIELSLGGNEVGLAEIVVVRFIQRLIPLLYDRYSL